MAMHWIWVGMNFARVADAAAAILHCVGVYALAITAGLRHTYRLVLARNRGEVANDNGDFVRIPAPPQIGYDAFRSVRHVDPVESFGLAIQTVQCWRAAVEMIEIAHQTPNALVQRFAEQLPVEPDIVVPLALLAELAAHEHQLVHSAQKRDRVEVLAPAERVRDPLPRVAAVVEVKHRGDRIDPDAVDVEFAQPVERARQQEIRDLAAAVIVDQRVPVGMVALPWVGVLVKRGTVKAAEPVRIGWEMPGNPIQ